MSSTTGGRVERQHALHDAATSTLRLGYLQADVRPRVEQSALRYYKAALEKVHTRTLADGTPAMSFGRLLAHLGPIVRNTPRPKGAKPGEATFTLTTSPTPKQRWALDLIDAIEV